MAVGDAYVSPGFLTPVLTQLFSPKPPTTFLTCFCRGERRKYAGKKSRLNRGSNSQPPGHDSDTLTTEPPGRGFKTLEKKNHHTHDPKKAGYKNILDTESIVVNFPILELSFQFTFLQNKQRFKTREFRANN